MFITYNIDCYWRLWYS